MSKAILAACTLVCLSSVAALGDGTVTITANSVKCQVPKPDDVTPPATPSVAAGQGAIRNHNYAQAAANLKPLAEGGNAEAERAYGNLLMTNCTGLQNKEEAVTWLSKAADANDVPAQTQLGMAYMNGNGAAQDDNKAFAYLSKAAAAGNANAEKSLGYLYLTGRGVAGDKYLGMAWSVKAGEQGDSTALSNIAWGYMQGDGLPQDNEKAAYYIAVAMAHAEPTDLSHLFQTRANIARKMSQDDMAYGVKRAKDWSPGPDSLSTVLRDAGRKRDQKS